MKRDVTVKNGKVTVQPAPGDALMKMRSLKLRDRVAAGGRLTDMERDLVLLALLQDRGLL